MEKWCFLLISAILLAACSNDDGASKTEDEKQVKTSQNNDSNETKKDNKENDKNTKEDTSDKKNNEKNSKVSKKEKNNSNNKNHQKKVIDGRTYIDGILIVNKEIALPKNYNPGEDPEARQAIEKLMQTGNQSGLQFVLRSGFRSYDTQATLYQNYVAMDGKAAADLYSAEPGHSEHQTGLAFDVGSVQSVNDFNVSFGQTPEGEWLKRHAHEFGFIIRYGENQTHITGYQYEPWHVRYVGEKHARILYKSKQTLEEYLGLYPKK